MESKNLAYAHELYERRVKLICELRNINEMLDDSENAVFEANITAHHGFKDITVKTPRDYFQQEIRQFAIEYKNHILDQLKEIDEISTKL